MLCRSGVTVLNQTPSAFRQLIEAQSRSRQRHGLQLVIFGGEALEVGMLQPWYRDRRNRDTQLINMYGITETTVHVTYCPLAPEDAQQPGRSPIGRRIPDLRIYLLDVEREPVPVGVAGELYVGGAGVARGYLNRPELTADRFLSDPFAAAPAARMYRTGDLGRLLADGSLEYLGRNDDQVKIRGFRIELGEIEARLASCVGVREAVVLAREDEPGEKRLVAYYTVKAGGEVTAETLRSCLAAALPPYMVPAAYVALEQLPLTMNGKLDRRGLPAPEASAYVSRAYEAPQGALEQQLAALWAQVLQHERIGRYDNFFELGGHSLLAMSLLERMRLVGLEADVRVLFGHPTLAALAATMGTVRGVAIPANGIPADCRAIEPGMLPLVALSREEIERIVGAVPGGAANVQDIYPLAPAQAGVLFHYLASEQGDPYLLSTTLGIDSRARLDEFLSALRSAIGRHDILRTAVLWEGLREPVQVVLRQAPLVVMEVALDATAGDVAEQLRKRFDPRRTRLDVRQAPMLRIFVAEDAPNRRCVMLLLFHHLIDDVTSMDLLSAEIELHLQGETDQLPPPVPFRNYVAQARLGVSAAEHEAFFRDLLGDVTEPTLPLGLLDVRGDGTGIAEFRRPVATELARRLRECARSLGVSTASLFHLAWALVLARTSGRSDVVFGTILLGRMQGGAGADRALGMFINMLPVRIRLGAEGAQTSVRRTHTMLAALLRHEHASLASAQRCSGVATPTPLFSAILNYRQRKLKVGSTAPSSQGWAGIETLGGEDRSSYPLCLDVDDFPDEFVLTAQVASEVDAESVCGYVHMALESLVDALEHRPEAPLHRLPVLPMTERRWLLEEYNIQSEPGEIEARPATWPLPGPEASASDGPIYEAPQGALEQQLESAWSEVLQHERIGRHDNFFELGGHSLSAMRLVSLLPLRGIQLGVLDLFEHPTIEALARKLSGNRACG
jgi:aryl carrier-like protein